MTAYLVVNTGKPKAPATARAAAQILVDSGANVLVDSDGILGADIAHTVLRPEAAYRQCDVVISIGGDGTMLHTARADVEFNKPLLGINVGRLGFMASVESDELEKLHRLSAGEYSVEQRSMLCAKSGDGQTETCFALNDIVLFKVLPEKTVSLDIFCDDILVSRFRGDGVIFATPAGSTAYSMSAGGPILDARLSGMVVTQICAHILYTPPLVVADERMMRAVNTGTDDEEIIIVCDGIKSATLGIGEDVYVTRSEWSVPLIQFNGAEQLESIDKKLKGR